MIHVENVTVRIKKHTILDHVSVDFESGQIHGLVGRNGSGKTMLMKCICGFLRPTEGKVEIDGKQVGKAFDFPKSAGIIIETPAFIPYYTGYKNLKLLAELNQRVGKEEIREAIKKVGLDPDLKLSVRKYSLGMRQRLGIAQAIMEDPALLVLDEPFNGLDEEGVVEMRELLTQMRKEGKTILLASHSSEDIAVLCDTVSRMDHGVLTDAKLRANPS